MIDVVAGVLIENNRILLGQRPEGKDFAFSWECPGGKVDEGETHHEALCREWREELSITVFHIPDGPIWFGDFAEKVMRADRAEVRMHFYRIASYSDLLGKIAPREGQGFGWFTQFEFVHLAKMGSLAPGNVKAFQAIWTLMMPPKESAKTLGEVLECLKRGE